MKLSGVDLKFFEVSLFVLLKPNLCHSIPTLICNYSKNSSKMRLPLAQLFLNKLDINLDLTRPDQGLIRMRRKYRLLYFMRLNGDKLEKRGRKNKKS